MYTQISDPYQAWAAAVKAPVDRDPLRGKIQQQHSPELSPSDFVLVLRPDIDSDEHLLPIHESPWTPDGKTWFQAKVSLLQGAPAVSAPGTAMATVGPRGSQTNGERGRGAGLLPLGTDYPCGSAGEGSKPLKSGGLSVTLRPEGAGQRRARLEREAIAAMAQEDERSRLVGRGVSRLDKEAAGRAVAAEEARRSSRLAAAVFTTRVSAVIHVDAVVANNIVLFQVEKARFRHLTRHVQPVFPCARGVSVVPQTDEVTKSFKVP